MADENIEIKIQDKVSPSISSKLKNIATEARTADGAVKNLQQQLSSLSTGNLNVILQSATQASRAIQTTTLASQRLATEQQRTATAAARAAAAQTNATTATVRGASAQQNLQTAVARTNTAQNQTATSAARLATETQRTAVQTANATSANNRAAISAIRLQQAQDRAALATRNAGSALAGYVRSAAGILGVTLSAGIIIKTADAYTTLQNKLQNVTTSQAQVVTLTEELFEVANRTRSGVDETATAFTRFDRALKVLGKSQEDSLQLTETVNKALIVSGATTGEQASALLQLSQAFNAGRLQGDEFRAVSENIPVVLDAIAKATGRPINEIKQMASEGKITAQVLYDSFALIKDQIDKTFAKTTATVGQSLVVLKNNAIQFFGELNKATGFTEGLSTAIIFLADHMRALAFIVALLGAAMLVSFGPAIVSGILAAATAVKAFTLALVSNPIGLIAVALASAIAYFTIFRNEILLGIDDVTTLGDFFSASFEAMGQTVDDLKMIVGQLWASIFNDASTNLQNTSAVVDQSTAHWYDSYTQFFETNKTGWAAGLTYVARIFDAMGGLITGFATFGGRAMAQLIFDVQNVVINSYNLITGYIESVTNLAIESANKLRGLLGKSAFDLVNFERMGNVGEKEFEGFGKLWAQSLEDGFKSQGGALEKVLNGVIDRSKELGVKRNASASAKLRGAGASQIGDSVDKKAVNAAEKRSLTLEKINTQLDNEINRMFQLKPLRDEQAKFDQIEESLIQKKIKLTDDEKTSIMAKIKAVQDATEVQKQFDSIYQEAIGPLKEYTATQEAATKLLSIGAISQEQYSRSVLKSSEAYQNSLDPMRQYNKDLQQQFDLLSLLPKQREIEQQIMQVQNDLLSKGIILNDAELKQLREKLTVIQQLNAVSQQEASLLANSVEQRKGYIDQLTAINNLLKNPDSGFTKSDALSAIGGTDAGANLAGSPEMLQAQVDQFTTMYQQIDELRQMDLISEQTASAAKLQIWNQQQNAQLGTTKTFFSSLEVLQNSSNSKMARIGKAAAIANALVNTYQAATGAYASLASIPYVGPALGAAAAAAAIAAGLANVSQIRSSNAGFMQGGYTGNIAKNEVAGAVHGQEFVMDAATTNRIGVQNLEALRSGAASVQQNSKSVAESNSNAPAKKASVSTTVSKNDVRIVNLVDPSLLNNYLTTPEGEQAIVNIVKRNSDSLEVK